MIFKKTSAKLEHKIKTDTSLENKRKHILITQTKKNKKDKN
jgi:hypothetical protein